MMKQIEQLREEIEFWLEYIEVWKTKHDKPVPEKALNLLDNALLKLRIYHMENDMETAKRKLH